MRYDHEAEFERRYYRWPQSRRGLYGRARNVWGWLFAQTPEDKHEALLAWIDRGIAHWLASRDARYLNLFDAFLADEGWRVVPEHDEPAPVVADAPPGEWNGVKLNFRCMCDTCASCVAMREMMAYAKE